VGRAEGEEGCVETGPSLHEEFTRAGAEGRAGSTIKINGAFGKVGGVESKAFAVVPLSARMGPTEWLEVATRGM
jgi:hypothetical protein